MTTDEGRARLRHAARYLPLVAAWSTDGPARQQPLTSAEADAVTLAVEALDAGRCLAVTLPGGRSRLPLLAAVAAAADPLVRPYTPRPTGTIALVTRAALRRAEVEALDVAATPVAAALGTRRLRGDGLVCRSGGSSVGELGHDHRLLFASTTAGLVIPRGGPVRGVIVDDTDDPNAALTAAALAWASQLGAPALVFGHLAAAPPAGWAAWPIDWPYLVAAGLGFGLDLGATAASGAARSILIADGRLAPLFRARATLARLQERRTPWPVPLAAVARFARILLDLGVPADLYDAHVPGTIARSLTRRRDELEETPPSALEGSWRDVGETDWARLKADVCTAHDALTDVNHKANALGLAVEKLLAEGGSVDVLCPSGVAAAATRTWLLEGGFAGIAGAVGSGRLDFRAIGAARPWLQQRVTVLPGLPAHRHRHRLADGDIGRLVVCCYPPEERRLAVLLDEVLNADRAANSVHRSAALTAVVGAPGRTDSPPVPVVVTGAEATLAVELEPADFVDVAEAAAFAALLDDRDDEDSDDGGPDIERRDGTWIGARALMVEPAGGGDAIALIVRDSTTLDRVTQGRVSTIRPGAIAPGMLLVGVIGEHRQGIFARLRPHLDVLHGPGTRLWLGLWHQALLQALRRAGSISALADALRARGATIRDAAVAAWASPYRIGPRDPRNVRRVGEVAGVDAVVANAVIVGAAMAGVRRRHRDIGVQVSRALRAAAAGRQDAFDRLERQLGTDVAELLGDITPWRVVSVSDAGWARPAALWRPLSPVAASDAFRTDRPVLVTPACDTRPATASEETV